MKLLFLAGWLSKSSRLPLSDKKLFFFLKEPVCSYMTEVWKIPALSKKCRSTSVMICYHRKKNCRMRYQTFTWRMNRAAHQRCYRIPTKWHIIHRSSLYLMATALIVGEVILKFFSWKHGSWWSTVSMLMFCLLWWTTSREKKKTADWWQVTIVMSVGK